MTPPAEHVERDSGHFRAAMAALQLGDVHAADEYLRDVLLTDGRAAYDAVCMMIAVRLQVPPKETYSVD